MFIRTALLLTMTALALGAQGHPRLERPRRDAAERPNLLRRERIAARLHEIRSTKLQQSLGLSDEKTKAIADRWAKFDEDSFSRRQQMVQLRQQVNASLTGPGSEEEKNKRLQPVVEQLAGLRQQQQEARKRFEEEIRGSLTPAQQGRFILLVDEFQKSLQEAIQDQRKDRMDR
jgi:hypothetical protein